ncbi:MAG: hypothetical protein WCD70_01585 [Alphaproteobacteria bacterium]
MEIKMTNIETTKISHDLMQVLAGPVNKNEFVLLHATLKATEVHPELLRTGLEIDNNVAAAFRASSQEFADRVESHKGVVMHHTLSSRTQFAGPISREEAFIAIPARALLALADDTKVVSLRFAKPQELKRFCGGPA